MQAADYFFLIPKLEYHDLFIQSQNVLSHFKNVSFFLSWVLQIHPKSSKFDDFLHCQR